jgi:hypothetical protein
MESIDRAVTSNYVRLYQGAEGISIYLPTISYDERYEGEGARWADDTMWDEFLRYIY